MGEIKNPENSGVSDPSGDEQIDEEGDGKENTEGEGTTGAIETETPAETETPDETVEEPTEEEEVTDPEVPAEPEEPGESTTDSVNVNADEAEATTYTVTIANYRTVLESATISADGYEISNDGKIAVELAAGATSKTVALTIKAHDHRKIKSVKSGETDWSKSGDTYSYNITADTGDTEVTIETAETYAFTLNNSANVKVQRLVTGEDGKTTKVDFATGEIDKDGADLCLVTDYKANNDALIVSYKVDGEDDGEVLTGKEMDDPTVETDPKKIRVYTIEAATLASLDSLEIILVKNTQVDVTFAKNDNVEIQVWGEKAGTDGAAATMDWIAIPSTGYKVIVGEKAKFKATAKDPYKITAVNATVDEVTKKISDASANGEYEFVVKSATEYSFDTEIDSEKSKTLTFKLDGDKNSATAAVTSVTLKATTEGGADKPLSGAELTSYLANTLGIPDGVLTADEGVKIPNTVAKIEVTATAAADYELSKISDTAVADSEKTTAKKVIPYDSIGDWKVTTAVAAKSTGDTFFKIALDTETVKHITLNTGAATGDNAVVSKVEAEGVTDTYKVKAETDTVSITMEASEGWDLSSAYKEALEKVAGVADVKSEVKDKKTVYTVKLLAKKLGIDYEANVTDLGSIAEEMLTFTAGIDEESSEDGHWEEYKVTADPNFPATGEDNIPYSATLEATVRATERYTLKSVTYTMGDAAPQTAEILKDSDGDGGFTDTAKIKIEHVTADVKIKVETTEAYAVYLYGASGTDDPEQPGYWDGDKTWAVKYDGKYVVNVNPEVNLSDLSAEIKDGETVVGRGRKIDNNLQIWMNRAWADKELTVDVKAKGVSIGELVLQVSKKRSTLALKTTDIKQDVASTMVYEIETDGEKLKYGRSAVSVSGDLKDKVDAKINDDGDLEVTVKSAKFADVNEEKTTGTGENAERKVIPKKASIVITDPEDSTLRAKATIQANAIFDTTSKPDVSLVDGGASDTDLVVSVGMDGVIAPKNASKVYYVITADAKADIPKTDETEESKRDQDKLEATVTEVVERTGSSQRVTLKVGKEGVNLGDGAAWDYDVTARVVYALDGVKPSKNVKAANVTAGTNSDVSVLSDKLETSTVDTLFEAALKLKKDSKKKPASTLYTGQENIYIATPQWSKKNVNYKITESYVEDITNGDLEAEINDAGDLVVTEVPEWTTIGKHTLQVTAMADKTAGHTMYASRATITVNVVKGINDFEVYVPGNQIFKQNNKKATYKATLGYTSGYDFKGKAIQPKTKKVTWSIVGANSTIDDSSWGSGSIDDVVSTPAPAGITIKNGTITVAKNFTIDVRHPQNNSFKVLVQANDFAGNTAATLSSAVYITNEALDVSNLIIAKRNYEKNGYDVLAVKEGTKSAKAQNVQAEEIDGACVYAAAKTVALGFVSNAKWNTLGVVDGYNLAYAPTKGNVLTVGGIRYYEDGDYDWADDNEIIVKASGKKATITVTAQDGSKKKNSIALNMGYTPVDSTAALKIMAYDAQDGNKKVEITKTPSKETDAETKVEKDFALPGVVRLDVDVYVAQRDDKGAFKKFEEINDYSNYKLTVSGGKVDSQNGYIYTNAKKTTINLTVGSGKSSKKYSYVLTNTAYDASGKAKVAVKNTLHTRGTEAEQIVKMSALNGKESFGDSKYAKVELDRSAWPKYNPGGNNAKYYAWDRFNDAIKSNYIKLDKDTGEFNLEFNAYGDDYVYLTAGSYKLKVTVGIGANAAAFKAETQPTNVTVKVVANKTLTFKPATSYKLSGVDGAAVVTGKSNINTKAGERLNVKYNIQNANVNGKSNLFTHYFKVEADEKSGTWYLKLNLDDELVKDMMYDTQKNADGSDKLDANGNKLYDTKTYRIPDLTTINKKDLTGYLNYKANCRVTENTYYNGEVNGAVKITVKPVANPKANAKSAKASQKYVPGSAELALAANSQMPVNITVNGNYVAMSYALIDELKKNSEELTLGGTNGVDAATGQVMMKVAAGKTLEDGKKYTANLYVMPATSLYCGLVEAAPNSAPNTTPAALDALAEGDTTTTTVTKADLIKKYGVAVKVTVVGKTKPTQTEPPKKYVDPEDPYIPEVPEKEYEMLNKLDPIIVAHQNGLHGMVGIDSSSYDSSSKRFTVKFDETNKSATIEESFRDWKSNVADQRKNLLIGEVESVLRGGDEWADLESVTLRVNGSVQVLYNNNKITVEPAEAKEKTFEKQGDETLTEFADRVYDDLTGKMDGYITKLKDKLVASGVKDDPTFEMIQDASGTLNVTINYAGGKTESETYTMGLQK